MKLQVKIFLYLLVRKAFLLSVFFLFVHTTAFSQDYLVKISSALKQGDAEMMSVYFDNSIDVTFSDKTNTYQKNQARVIIQKFLNKIEPKEYVSVQRGASKSNNTRFHIGTLYSSKGVYKVYMFFVLQKGQYYLKELRFEK